MKYDWMNKTAGMGIAAGLAMASAASAANWCPTPSSYTISCSNCNRTLTCDFGGRIRITGSNVVLDGNGHSLTNSPSYAVDVTGNGSTIKNLEILWPAQHGIYYHNTGGSSYVDNVFISGAGATGIYAESIQQNLYVTNSEFVENGDRGIYTTKGTGMINWTDVSNSTMDHNHIGWHTYRGYWQIHSGNSYTDNSSVGARESEGERGTYSYSTFNNNGSTGLELDFLEGVQPLQITNNSGYGNTRDCQANEVHGLVVSNNSWVVNEGCDNIP